MKDRCTELGEEFERCKEEHVHDATQGGMSEVIVQTA